MSLSINIYVNRKLPPLTRSINPLNVVPNMARSTEV
ncbi:unnamed protein product [Arabidopsis halleri]